MSENVKKIINEANIYYNCILNNILAYSIDFVGVKLWNLIKIIYIEAQIKYYLMNECLQIFH